MTARILVIEDNEANRMLVDYLLRAHGYEPLLADNGADGLVLASQHLPDLILLDIRMPGMDGYAVAAAVREQTALRSTKIVALTASAMLGDRERIAAAGFDGYIPKPIDPERFLSQVEGYLPAWEHGIQPKAGRR
jgi:CheY-like chemotaxis protein